MSQQIGHSNPIWRACATQVNMDVDKIAEMSEGDAGEALFAENIRRANLLGINASPHIGA